MLIEETQVAAPHSRLMFGIRLDAAPYYVGQLQTIGN